MADVQRLMAASVRALGSLAVVALLASFSPPPAAAQRVRLVVPMAELEFQIAQVRATLDSLPAVP